MELILTLIKEHSEHFLQMGMSMLTVLLILIIGWLIAKTVASIVKKILSTIGIDTLADKLHEIDIIHKANIKIIPSTLISKLLYYVILFVFLSVAADYLGLAVVSNLIADLIVYIPKLVSALVVVAIGVFIAEALRKVVRNACQALNIPGAVVISGFLFYFLLINVVLMAMKQAEINTDFLTANLSLILGGIVFAFAIGYGFASRDIMANLLGGLYIKNKFKEGDEIRVGKIKGVVTTMDGNSLTLKTEDSSVIIPLGKLTNEKVEIF